MNRSYSKIRHIQEVNRILEKKILNEQGNKIIHVGPLELYGGWHGLQEYLKKKGNPDYVYDGDLYLYNQKNIDTLGNLVKVNGTMNLMNTYITSLGRLMTVTGSVGLNRTELNNLGHLMFIKGDLHLSKDSPILKRYSEEEINRMIKIDGKIVIGY